MEYYRELFPIRALMHAYPGPLVSDTPQSVSVSFEHDFESKPHRGFICPVLLPDCMGDRVDLPDIPNKDVR